MKTVKVESKVKRRAYWLIGLLVFTGVVAVGVWGLRTLRDLYLEQCVIVNLSEQISITSGKMVKPDVIAENLGLKVGANLATIDFKTKREEILKKIPTLREISISRILPDRLRVVAEERVPIARMALRNQRQSSGRVIDTEGMVFTCLRGTQMLPIIRESAVPGVQPGHRVTGRTLAALRLLETCRESEYLELGLLEVDLQKPDFLTMTLSDYSRVKIIWDGMDAPNERSRADLTNRLSNLLKAIRSKIGVGTVIWNATMPDMIFADNQQKP